MGDTFNICDLKVKSEVKGHETGSFYTKWMYGLPASLECNFDLNSNIKIIGEPLLLTVKFHLCSANSNDFMAGYQITQNRKLHEKERYTSQGCLNGSCIFIAI